MAVPEPTAAVLEVRDLKKHFPILERIFTAGGGHCVRGRRRQLYDQTG